MARCDFDGAVFAVIQMSRSVVISQSMYFPWVGFLEQMRLADVFVRYDDVQYSKGSFTNRVQIKSPQGSQWLTVPLKKFKLGTSIDNVEIDDKQGWRKDHLAMLGSSYADAPYFSDMMNLVQSILCQNFSTIADLAFFSQQALFKYFEINPNLQFHDVRALSIVGKSSQRVLDVVSHLQGDCYITGHGAHRYLDHGIFESAGIDVQYMQYEKTPYPQQHGVFTPYVSALDLVANCGKQGVSSIRSSTCNWRNFKHEST
jgi:WbqC-like protein family